MAGISWLRPGRNRTAGARILEHSRTVVAAANALEATVRAYTDQGLRAFADELRQRHCDGATLDALLPEAAAVVRETAHRVLGLRLEDVQLMGGSALHLGSTVEMRTGEGKTLTITIPTFLHALSGRGVHVMTANDYLAERDAALTEPVYQALGLTCGLAVRPAHGNPVPAERRAAYAADVTYGTPYELAYDYLRDTRVWSSDETVQRGRHLAVVDEADLLLFDEAGASPVLSRNVAGTDPAYAKMTPVVQRLRPGLHYTVDPARKLVTLTEAGTERIEDLLGVADLHRTAGARLLRTLDNVLRAKEVFQRDRDYLVENGAVETLNTRTGRITANGAFGGGLMQAIAAKEGLPIPQEEEKLATVTLHGFLRGYEQLTAITGVATEAEAYRRVYGLETVRIPTHRPVRRVDQPARYYPDDRARLDAAIGLTAARRAAGQPVLLGTASINQSEQVSAALTTAGIPHTAVSAKNHIEEAELIARAGRVGAVTVVTRMVGRGVDIRLGGDDPAEHDAIVRSGGLFVLALDLYETRRLELHMRGRAGRRGDPGESAVYLAVTDESLVKLVGPKHIGMLASIARDPNNHSRLTNYALERALDNRTAMQVEQLSASVRYDDVAQGQFDRICRQRRNLLEGGNVREWVRTAIDDVVGRLTAASQPGAEGAEQLRRALADLYPISISTVTLAALRGDDLTARVRADVRSAYERREGELTAPVLEELERRVQASVTDRCWPEHLQALADMSADTALYSLTGSDPLARYQLEAARQFTELTRQIEQETVGYLFNLEVTAEPAE
ncbi:preprotein translocase subunit SecA [Streptomyces sp. NPDC005065]|uniref:preprotein translocase subunit SecA n=1 Tax=Streptomyces sp. NPDC005065 TaxID=3154461 RepID=UPI0033BF833E